MKKQYKIALIALPILIGGYLIYRQVKGRETYEDAVEDSTDDDSATDDSGNGGSGNGSGGGSGSGGGTNTGFAKYEVTTLVSNLNIRQEPSTNSTILTTVAKGKIIDAKASSTSGWMQVKVGSINGFASAQYLTKI